MLRTLSVLVTLGLSVRAHATVPDKFGVGADNMGMGGGGVAHVGDGAAALMNPAGLYRVRRPMLSAGLMWGTHNFTTPPPVWWDTNRDGQVDERDPPLDLSEGVSDMFGMQLDIGRQLGSRFGVGLAAYVPLNRLFRLKTFDPLLPNYILYDNRPQRYVLAAGVGGMVVPGLHLGVGADVVPRVAFTVAMSADIGITGNEDAQDLGELVGDVVIDVHEINLDVVPGIAPVVGLQLDFGRWTPILDGLMIGATWRNKIGVPIDAQLDIQANIRATDIGELEPFVLAGVIGANLNLFDHFVPMKVDMGLSYRYDPFVTAYVDIRWTAWSDLLLSVAQLGETSLTTPLFDLEGAIRDGNPYQLEVKDTWNVRLGAEMNFPKAEFTNKFRYLQVTTRAGFGWEPSPLVSQGDDSAFLDANRWFLTGGLGLETYDPLNLFNGPIHLDAFFQYHRLVPAALSRTSNTPRAGYPVDATGFVADGSILVIGAEIGIAY